MGLLLLAGDLKEVGCLLTGQVEGAGPRGPWPSGSTTRPKLLFLGACRSFMASLIKEEDSGEGLDAGSVTTVGEEALMRLFDLTNRRCWGIGDLLTHSWARLKLD